MVGSMIPVRISPEAQRGLILLSKTLQQLANGTDFGWKEAYASPTLSRPTRHSIDVPHTCVECRFMLPLNSFLHESRPTMNAIFESVAVRSPHSSAEWSTRHCEC